MGFVQVGQDWHTWAPKGSPKDAIQHLRVGSWAWLEEREGESGLCPVGECVTIEEAIQLEDADGNEIHGALTRATRWEIIAKRKGLPIPKQRSMGSRKVSKRRSTKAA